MTKHLKNNHPHKAHPQSTSTSNGNGSIAAMIEQIQPAWTQTVSDSLLVRFIIHNNLPFRLVESPHLRALLLYQRASNQIPKSADTAQRWAISDYDKTKSDVGELLKNALTSIHLSIDGWTSPHQTMAVLGIIAHFVGADGRLYGIVVGFEELDGPHTGSNMADCVSKVIEDYHIRSSVGYLVMDNASSNDTLAQHLEPNIHSKNWRWEERRLRCFGHIINLSVKAFWFGESNRKTREKDVLEMIVVDQEEEESDEARWREMGPWGKIHNLCNYIRASTERRNSFLKLGAKKMVTMENATRWNSGYKMVTTALELRNFIQIFCDERHPLLSDDTLSHDEWQQLVAVKDILKPFWESTLRMERRTVTIAMVIPQLEFLSFKYREVIAKYATEREIHVVQAANLGLSKLEKYYSEIKELPAYLAAVALDPCRKFQFFESSTWSARDVKNAKDHVINLWERQYKRNDLRHGSPIPEPEREQDEYDKWDSKKRRLTKGDELEQYLAEPTELTSGEPNYLEWWYQKRDIWPQLSRMALDILSIPSMSADAERLFSSGKMVMRDNRSRLSSKSMVALECLKSWEREGITQSPLAAQVERLLASQK
jgi:hAT family C-terminal dimerisation region